jgi:hypothetical protein
MTFGPYDLRLTAALAEERLAAARRTPATIDMPQSAPGRPVRKSRRHGALLPHRPIQLHRPAHGTAVH